jgi:ketosteroid isomerase-like protein
MTIQTLELDELAKTRDAHVAALNANDADGWVACFAPDATQMPPNDLANVGTANIRAWSAGMLSACTVVTASQANR